MTSEVVKLAYQIKIDSTTDFCVGIYAPSGASCCTLQLEDGVGSNSFESACNGGGAVDNPWNRNTAGAFSGKINCIEAFVSASNGINVDDVIIATSPSQPESTLEEDAMKQPIQCYFP